MAKTRANEYRAESPEFEVRLCLICDRYGDDCVCKKDKCDWCGSTDCENQQCEQDEIAKQCNNCYSNPCKCDDFPDPTPPTGGGGGGGNNPNPNPPTTPTDPSKVATKSKKILNCSNLSLNDQLRLEDMMTKVIADCMGGALYSGLVTGLNGQTVSIEFNPYSSSSYLQNGIITIGTCGTDSEALFHELYHVYQSFGETRESYPNGALNREVEAWCAEYMYASKQSGFQSGTLWYDIYQAPGVGFETQKLAESLNSKGQYSDPDKTNGQINSLVTAFREYPEYANKTFDGNRSITENLKNIQDLAKNC